MSDDTSNKIAEQIRESSRIYYEKLQKFVDSLRLHLTALTELHERVSAHWTYHDLVYRFYHGSFKVFWLNEHTKEIVAALQAVSPDTKLDKFFMAIYDDAMSRQFVQSRDPAIDTNSNWLREARPVLEAFFHAKYFLDMAVLHGKEMTDENLRKSMPSGWAGLLSLYNLR